MKNPLGPSLDSILLAKGMFTDVTGVDFSTCALWMPGEGETQASSLENSSIFPGGERETHGAEPPA